LVSGRSEREKRKTGRLWNSKLISGKAPAGSGHEDEKAGPLKSALVPGTGISVRVAVLVSSALPGKVMLPRLFASSAATATRLLVLQRVY